MKIIKLILGDITFLDEQIDGESKAIINSIDNIIYCESTDEAEIIGENSLNVSESYLIPSLYQFPIENPNNLKY